MNERKKERKKRIEEEKVYFKSQILECSSIRQYWNIYFVPVLLNLGMFTRFRT